MDRIIAETDAAATDEDVVANPRRPWKTPRVILSELEVGKPTPFPTENIGSLPTTATGPS